MILNLKDIQDSCKIILNAVDSSALSEVTDKLELSILNNNLRIGITNGEYYASINVLVNSDESLHATVNSEIFLKLISNITTETVELKVKDNNLIVIGNGTYKIPMIYDGDSLLHLEEIGIENITKEFQIESNYLKSIFDFNSKELSKGTITKTVQKLYYVDKDGAITFTNGACVNKFDLGVDIKLLLTNKIVKLFKLFDDGTVHCKFGYNSSGDMNRPIISFITDKFQIDCQLNCDELLLNSIPVSAIRGRVDNQYLYNVCLDKKLLLDTINRISIFSPVRGNGIFGKKYGIFVFDNNGVTVYDEDRQNHEVVKYETNTNSFTEEYTCILNLHELQLTVETLNTPILNCSFGDNTAVVFRCKNVCIILPECELD